jgi:hypothetical protein
MTESCSEKTRRLVEWQDAMNGYSKAVADLSRRMGVVRRPEYERLSQAAEDSRKIAIKAKANLDAHTREHGCDGGTEVAA